MPESQDLQHTPAAPQVDTRLQKPSQWSPADNLGGGANTRVSVCVVGNDKSRPTWISLPVQATEHTSARALVQILRLPQPPVSLPEPGDMVGERDHSQEVVMRPGRESGCEDQEDGDNRRTKVGWSGEEAGGPDICGTREGRGCPLSQRPGSTSWCLVFL